MVVAVLSVLLFSVLLLVAVVVRLHFLGGFRRRGCCRYRVWSMLSAWTTALAASDARVCRCAVIIADIWFMVSVIVEIALHVVVVSVVVGVTVAVGVDVVVRVGFFAGVVVFAVVVGVGGTLLGVELVRFAVMFVGSVGFGANLAPRRFQAFLSLAISASSSKVFVAGASSKMLPGLRFKNCTLAAIFTSLLSFIRSMCPSQTKRQCLTAATRS